jgi:hypothetical protein
MHVEMGNSNIMLVGNRYRKKIFGREGADGRIILKYMVEEQV